MTDPVGVAQDPRPVLMMGDEPTEATPDEAYAAGRADQLEDDLRLLAWAYRKLAPYSFSKQEDALAMDEIKLMLMGAA